MFTDVLEWPTLWCCSSSHIASGNACSPKWPVFTWLLIIKSHWEETQPTPTPNHPAWYRINFPFSPPVAFIGQRSPGTPHPAHSSDYARPGQPVVLNVLAISFNSPLLYLTRSISPLGGQWLPGVSSPPTPLPPSSLSCGRPSPPTTDVDAKKVNERVGEKDQWSQIRSRGTPQLECANILSRHCRVFDKSRGVCLQTRGHRSEKIQTKATPPCVFLCTSSYAIFKSCWLLSAEGQAGMARIKMADAEDVKQKKPTKLQELHFCMGCLLFTSARWVNSIKQQTNSILYSFVSLIISQPLLFPPDWRVICRLNACSCVHTCMHMHHTHTPAAFFC